MTQKWQGIPSRSSSPSCSLLWNNSFHVCVGEDRYPEGTGETSLQVGKRAGDKRYSCGRGENARGTTATGRGGVAEGRKMLGEDTEMSGCLTRRYNQNKQDHCLRCLSLSR